MKRNLKNLALDDRKLPWVNSLNHLGTILTDAVDHMGQDCFFMTITIKFDILVDTCSILLEHESVGFLLTFGVDHRITVHWLLLTK